MCDKIITNKKGGGYGVDAIQNVESYFTISFEI